MALDISTGKKAEKKGGINVAERGRAEDGSPTYLDRRVFMQLLVYTDVADTDSLVRTLEEAGIPGVLYADVHDPRGVGLLTFSDDPAFFVDTLRPFLQSTTFAALEPRPGMTMFGRTYAIGYETDLDDVLLRRSIRYACNPEWPWAVWYPLRRSGAFAMLSADDQRKLLMEHGGIGMAYGRADHGHDIRLASFGMDRNDNDFTVALVGKALGPLSKIVEHMRKTKQTSEYMDSLGPFFVGRALWQNAVYPDASSD